MPPSAESKLQLTYPQHHGSPTSERGNKTAESVSNSHPCAQIIAGRGDGCKIKVRGTEKYCHVHRRKQHHGLATEPQVSHKGMVETRGGQRCKKKIKDQSANVRQSKCPHDFAAEPPRTRDSTETMAPSTSSLAAQASFPLPLSMKTRIDEKKCRNQFLYVDIGDDTLKSIACWVTSLLSSEVRPKSRPSTAAGCAAGYVYMLLVRDVNRTSLAWVKIGKTRNPKARRGYWDCHFPSSRFVTYWKEFPTTTMDDVESRILKKMKSVMNSGAYLVPDGVRKHLESQLVLVPKHLQPELEVARRCYREECHCGVRHHEIFPFAVPAGQQNQSVWQRAVKQEDKPLGHILAITDQPELISKSYWCQSLIVPVCLTLTFMCVLESLILA